MAVTLLVHFSRLAFIPKRLKNKSKTSCFVEFATVVVHINKFLIALLAEKATFDSRMKALREF